MQTILVFLCAAVIAVSSHHVPHHSNPNDHTEHHSTQKPHTSSPHKSVKQCDFGSTKGHHLCDHFYPSNCFPPICATGTNGETKWFKNECYLDQTNRECSTKYKRVDDSKCDAKKKPAVNPKPCPIIEDYTVKISKVTGTIVHQVKEHCSCH